MDRKEVILKMRHIRQVPFDILEPIFADGIWTVPIGLSQPRGVFPNFRYRKLMSLDLGLCDRFEFYGNGEIKYRPTDDEIIYKRNERIRMVKSKIENVLQKSKKLCMIKPNRNIENILRKIFNISYDNGTFFIDRDLDWISEDDIDGIENFAWDLRCLENKGLIEYTELCREYNRELVTSKGYYPDNALIEIANNVTDIDDLINNVLGIMTLDEDVNGTLWY